MHSVPTDYDDCYPNDRRTSTSPPTHAEAPTKANAETPTHAPPKPDEGARTQAPRAIDAGSEPLARPRSAFPALILTPSLGSDEQPTAFHTFSPLA